MKNIFRKGKYFLVFGCILKIILENNFQCLVTLWKCYFPTKFFTFSQLLNKFYITKSTTTHISAPHKKSTTTHTLAPIENPPLSTQKPTTTQHRNHQNTITHTTTTTTTTKSEIKERKQIDDEIDLEEEIDQRVADDEIDPKEEMIWPRGGRDRSSSDRLHVVWSHQCVWLREVEGFLLSLLSLSACLSLEMVWSENKM